MIFRQVRRRVLFALLVLLAAVPARAEVAEVRTATQLGLTFLALMVMEHDGLVEKQARQRGLGELKTSWTRVADGGAMNDALLSGSIEFAPGGVPAFLTMWDKTQGNFNVKAIGSYNALTLSLLVRDPNVKSIKDLTDKDRIAVPGVQASSQALLLEMAAERAWGPGNAHKLDPLTVSRGHPDAVTAFLSSSSEITAHFSAHPFVDRELQMPGVHAILTSREVYGGPGTIGVVYATSRFCDKNPKTCEAYFAALSEAMDVINKDRRHVAEVYLDVSKVKDTVDNVQRMLDSEPDWTITPHGTVAVAEFMHRIGTLKHEPGSWKDLFFPVAQALNGD